MGGCDPDPTRHPAEEVWERKPREPQGAFCGIQGAPATQSLRSGEPGTLRGNTVDVAMKASNIPETAKAPEPSKNSFNGRTQPDYRARSPYQTCPHPMANVPTYSTRFLGVTRQGGVWNICEPPTS